MNASRQVHHLVIAVALAAAANASAQTVAQHQFPGGGWGVIQAPQEHIDAAEKNALWEKVQDNIAGLRAQGRLPQLKANVEVRFSWPTQAAAGRPEFHDHLVSAFVDQDQAGNSLRDFSCGTRTYAVGGLGGGHQGTDISVGFRPFLQQDTEQVVVVAAAPGTIIAKDDTQPDRSCGNLAELLANPVLKNNVIAIRHADASVALYYHVKTGTLTTKNIGDTVAEGEYLGVVGSSGYSSGPHLHFELRSADNTVVDPWAGACNTTTPVSLWKAQESYLVQEIMDLMPTSTVPSGDNMDTTCTNHVADGKSASSYLQPDFYVQPGVQHNFVAFLRDIDSGSQVVLSLYRPDGSQYAAVNAAGGGYAATAYVYIYATIPAGEPAGQWSFAVTYGGKTRAVPFQFKAATPVQARVFEFHNATLNHYFRTASAAEAASLTPASGFLPTGNDFFALDRAANAAGVSPVCRFYGSVNPGPNSHFYTADPYECGMLKQLAVQTPPDQPRWNYEEIAFATYLPVAGVCPAAAPFPVYRLYNQRGAGSGIGSGNDGNHRFTTRSSIYNQMGMSGWAREGIVMCAESMP